MSPGQNHWNARRMNIHDGDNSISKPQTCMQPEAIPFPAGHRDRGMLASTRRLIFDAVGLSLCSSSSVSHRCQVICGCATPSMCVHPPIVTTGDTQIWVTSADRRVQTVNPTVVPSSLGLATLLVGASIPSFDFPRAPVHATKSPCLKRL